MSQCLYCGDDPGLQVTASWDIKLACKWPSRRQLGPRTVDRLRQHYYHHFSTAYVGRPWLEPATKPRRVILAWLRGKLRHTRSPDSLVAGAKPVIDALVAARLVNNDDSNDELIHICQAKSPDGKESIHVRIDEIL